MSSENSGYLGFVPKMGETLWYVATVNNEWVSILSFSVSALKCKARDQWIGWSYRHQYGRLKLIVNNNRFLILPGWHIRNLASRTLSLCLKRLVDDWAMVFGHKIVVVEKLGILLLCIPKVMPLSFQILELIT